MDLLSLALAWLLGLLAPTVVRHIERVRRAREVGRGLLKELDHLKGTLGTVAFRLKLRNGTLDRPFLEWYQKSMAVDPEVADDPEMAIALQEVLGRPANLLNRGPVGKSTPGHSPRPVAYRLPFLETQLGNLDLFPVDFQEKIVRIRHYLDLYNNEVDWTKSMFEKTFDPSIVEDNRRAVEENLGSGYDGMERRAGDLARDIGRLIDAYQEKFGAI